MNELTKPNNIQTLQERLDNAFLPVIQTIESLRTEHEEMMSLELTDENCLTIKTFAKKYQKLRSATDQIHKSEKAFYLEGGRAVGKFKTDTYKLIEPLEKEALERGEYFINLEKGRIAKLQAEREAEYKKNGGQDIFIDLGNMPEDVWNNFLAGVKQAYELRIEAEKKAEAERLQKEAEERAERERMRAENERLRKEAEQKEEERKAELDRIEKENAEKLRIERAEREKKEQELRAVQEAEKERIRLEKEAEEKYIREKAEKDKALKEGSDREKWNAYISALKDITKPELSSEIYKAYQAKLNEFFVKTVK